jgi:GAF domain-containing protein
MLARARDQDAVSRTLLEACLSLLDIDFAAVALVSEDGEHAHGLQAMAPGRDTSWWAEVTLDLEREPSGIASAVFEGGPVVVSDIAGSQRINPHLAEKVGAKSSVFVPIVSEERVLAVLVVATTQAPKAFSGDELSLLQALAAEAALALDRTRSADALAEALERERLVASIGRKVRSELDLDAVLRVAVEETGAAIGVDRCFLRLGERESAMPMAAEWHAQGLGPIGEFADRLSVTNLAARERRTVVVADVREDPALEDAELGGVQTLLDLDTLAVLATPVLVFDEMVGVFGLHRSEPGEWSEGEVLVAEAVARELGVAIHAARLLKENAERLEQQTALLKAAQVVTSELRLETVLQRLVVEVTKLLEADAAVHGLGSELVEFELPVGSEAEDRFAHPLPHPAYEGFAGAISAPMTWSGERRGLLGVATRDSGRSFGELEKNLLETFAGLASLAVRNAASFEQSVRQARVQRSMPLRTRPTRRSGAPSPPC